MSDATAADDRNDPAPVGERPEDSAVVPARPLGFVGLGAFGMAVAVRLAERFPLLACDADPARLSLLMDKVEHDARVHTTPLPAELAERCDMIVVLQPSAAEAEAAVADLAARACAGTMLLDLSASHPAATRRLAAELSDRSVHLLDAVLLGTEGAAEQGGLTILAGGAEAVLAEARPYLEPLGTVIRAGAIGTGHALAALLGAVAASPEAADEAARIADASGIDPALLARLSAAGLARPSADGVEIALALGSEARMETPALEAAMAAFRLRAEDIPPS